MKRQRQSWDDDKLSYIEFELDDETTPEYLERKRKAGMHVVEYAEDATLARELLDMLGLGA